MATAGQEVLPIALEGKDNTSSAWQSFKRQANDAKGAVDQLKNAIAGLDSGSTKGIGSLTELAKYAKNPVVALALAIAGVGAAGVITSRDLARVAGAADEIGTKASAIFGLGDALKKAGGEAEDAVTGLKNLRTQIDLNARDGGYLENLFKLNGSSLYEASGQVKSISQIYRELAGFIGNARNQTEGLEIATNAFGSAGENMRKAILAGAKSLEDVAKTDLDPVIRQSKEIDQIWSNIEKGSQGWIGGARNFLGGIGNELRLAAAAIAGSQDAIAMQARGRDPSAGIALKPGSQTLWRTGYDWGGEGEKTKTPSNRPEPSSANFDRTLANIGKQIALMEADARAVGKTAGEHARLRVETQLLEAAQLAGIPKGDKRREQFEELAQAARKAADALAYAKLQDDIFFERAQMGRSETDQIVAARLRSAGIDPSSDQAAFLAEQIKINEALKLTGDLSKDALKSFISDLRAGVDPAQALLRALDKVVERFLVLGIDNGVNGLVGLFGGGPSLNANGSIAGAVGPTSVGGAPLVMHGGGIVGAGNNMRRAGGWSNDNVPRLHSGLLPDEFRAILRKGEGVFTPEHMAAMAGAIGGGGRMPQVNVTLVERSDGGGQVSQKQNSNGGLDLEITVAHIAAKSAATPGGLVNRAITTQLGGRQRLGGR